MEKNSTLSTVKLALWNVKALSNKSFLIIDLICTHSDFLLLTKTWLDHAKTATTLTESAPPLFSFMSDKNYGIAIISKTSFKWKQFSFGDSTLFEYLCSFVAFL